MSGKDEIILMGNVVPEFNNVEIKEPSYIDLSNE